MNQIKSDSKNNETTSIKGQIKAKWNKLSDQDVSDSEKNMKELSGRIQKAYGRTKDAADKEISEFKKTLPSEQDRTKHIS